MLSFPTAQKKKEASYSYVEFFNLYVFYIASNSIWRVFLVGWKIGLFRFAFLTVWESCFPAGRERMTRVYFIGGLNKFKQIKVPRCLTTEGAHFIIQASLLVLSSPCSRMDLIFTGAKAACWPTRTPWEGSVHDEYVIQETSKLWGIRALSLQSKFKDINQGHFSAGPRVGFQPVNRQLGFPHR